MDADLPAREERGLAPLLTVALLSLGCTALLWLRTDRLVPGTPLFSLPWDHHMYISMAQHGPFGFHIAPYNWRVLGPVIVWALPLGVQGGFQVVTFLSVWLTGLLVVVLLERLGFGRALALAGMLMYFSLGYATKFTLFDFWLTDPLAFLLVTVAVVCVLGGHDLAFAACLAVGVLAKESVIFVAPLYYSLNARRAWDGRLAVRTLGLTLPAVAALVGVHVAIPEMNGDPAYVRSLPRLIQDNTIPSYTYGSVLHHAVTTRLHHWPSTLVKSISAFGLLVPILVVTGLRRYRRLALRMLPFVVLAYVQLLFALNTERLLVLAFPALIPLAVGGMRTLMDAGRVGPRRFVLLAGVFFAIQLVGRHEWEPNPLVQLAVLAAFLPFLVPWRPWRRRPDRGAEHEGAPSVAAASLTDSGR
ncbi:MAG: hypothetical protein M3Q23_06785 [Actinomycetota bacterium]|nr:hypothetical protein [Actinomycetota bacterium]